MMSKTRIESKQESKEIKTSVSIPSIQNAKNIIKPFKSLSKTAGQAQFVEGALNNFDTMTAEEIGEFSKILNTWVDDKSLSKEKIPGTKDSFADVLYQVSLALAAAKPINDDDFATGDKIDPANRIVTSDRYQFDINAIVHWINTKGCFENPYTQCQFSQRDQATIKNMAAAKRIKIEKLKSKLDENPALLAGALSAIEQEGKPDFDDPNLEGFFGLPLLFFTPRMPSSGSGTLTIMRNGEVMVTTFRSNNDNFTRSTSSRGR